MAGNFGRMPEQNKEDSLSHGIKSACMSDFFLPQSLETIGTLSGRKAAGLIDDQKTVLLFHRNQGQYTVLELSSSRFSRGCGGIWVRSEGASGLSGGRGAGFDGKAGPESSGSDKIHEMMARVAIAIVFFSTIRDKE